MPPQPVQRYHSLDALRGAMMLLGLVLHSAASYTDSSLGWAWPYHDRQTSVVFDLLIFFIHLFRMPVFFVVAGFFGAVLYYRDGPAGFARNRARRVLLPLVLFWVVMVPSVGMGFMFAARQIGGPLPFEEMMSQPLLRQPVLGHLWFLYDLLIFYAAAIVIVRLAARVPADVRQRANLVFRIIASKAWGVFAMALLTALTLVPMDAPGFDTSAALLPPVRMLAGYGVFFAFGWLLSGHREVIPLLGDRWKAALAAGACASLGYLLVVVARPIADPVRWHLAASGLAGVAIWLLIVGIVGLFVRQMDKPRPLVRYLSDASYWMYLVHLAPAIWIPGLLARSAAPAVVKFAVVLGVTTLLTAVTYHYFVRSTVIGELLNGRRYPRSVPLAGSVRDGAAV